MAITLVQSGTNGSNAGTAASTVTLGSATTAGNCLVVMIGIFASSTTVSGVTLGGSANHFASVATGNVTNWSTAAWLDPNCTGGQTSVAVTFSPSDPGTEGIYVYEFSGLAASSVLDKTSNHGLSTTGTPWTSNATATTTKAAEAWVGIVTTSSGGTTITGPSSPWNNLAQLNESNSPTASYVSGYQIRSSTGAATYSGTFSTSNDYDALVVTLKPAPDLPGLPAFNRQQAVKRAAYF